MADNSPPDQPPVYGGKYGMPTQPSDYSSDYGAPTQPPALGPGYTPPAGPVYATPPPGSSQVPIPPSAVGRTARRAGGIGLSLLIRLGIAALFLFGGAILYGTGILSHVSAPDYPGAQKSSLSAAGKTMADSLYEDHNADTSHVKAFYTTDDVPAVSGFYKSKLTADGWTLSDEQNEADSAIAVYDKDKQETVLMTGPSTLHWVQNAPDNSTSIILLIGDTSGK
jgi:hypothetical protein